MSEVPSLEVLYRDDNLIAINKPSGLLVHRSLIDKRETRFAIQLLRDQIGQRVYPLHRLDKPTSGVLLFALDTESAREGCQMFRDKEVDKTYLAIVRGWTEDSGQVDYPLREELDKTTDEQADPDSPAKDAVTDYRTLGRTEVPQPVGRYPSGRYSLVLAQPRTGRKHQLRRHFAHLRHPVVGDTTHGDGAHNRFFRETFNSHRLLLHAWKVGFCHPISGEKMHLSASMDETLTGLLEEFGWNTLLGTAENR